ncbi:GntR family transcriptional regulator [Erysipelothrix sp. HDW6A]|uniref:GntR family transcriptional regulator n=1 Tax=Erysipelothrix sp. HDW6A TaxID=2714928 RepID=UPI0014094426|nr:GntR family transcriptional regulator [Erysipelothrix sp. HDW6A]QIK56568.1 GntR family transcriptional regulator [Erysipelothrix sp. HDW6A]
MFSIQSNSNQPIFEQIIEQVGKFIALGVLKPNDQLPTVRSLAKDLGINPNTVAKAYHECEMNGLIISQAGVGFFVSDSQEDNPIVTQAYETFLLSYKNLIELGETEESILNYLERYKQ